MPRGKASGISLTKNDARIVLGMELRGDRNHDIAAWFGVNQGRVAEVKNGDFGILEAAQAADLPPQGPPGIKGRRIREATRKAIEVLEAGSADSQISALSLLKLAVSNFDANEA